MKLSIVICAYNEVKTIDKLIKKVCEVELINDFEKEILIFDNNSDDGTKDILNKYSNLDNIKIFDDDVRELLLKIQDEVFDEVYIICPDPWPKARHHKRRLIKHDFLKVLAKVLKKDGTIYISTDWENYAESIQEEIEKTKENFALKKISNEGMPITRFQQRAINEGRSIHTFLLKVLKK